MKYVIVIVVLVFLSLFEAIAEAQHTGEVFRIGRLSPISSSTDIRVFDGFRQELKRLGWIENQNIVYEYRFANGQLDRLPALAAELVRLEVDVIVAGSTPGALAAKNATRTIPIVMITTGDPVGGGIVSSLARPGGNLTGVTALSGEVGGGKRLELLINTMPGITRVAILAEPTSPYTRPFLQETQRVAQTVGVQLHILEVSDPNELDQAFAAMHDAGDEALMVGTDPLFNAHRGRLVELAAKGRLPAMYGLQEFIAEGGLMFYGASLPHMYRRAATLADKILKGAKPADLPIEQPTKFDLVINLKTATALGLTIPPEILFQATEVIQ